MGQDGATDDDETKSALVWDKGVILDLRQGAARTKRSKNEAYSAIFIGTRLPILIAPDPESWWRAVQIEIFVLAMDINPPSSPRNNRKCLELVAKKANELSVLCQQFPEDGIDPFNEVPFYLIIDHLNLLNKMCEDELMWLRERKPGRHRRPFRSYYMRDLIQSFESGFGVPATDNDAGDFARFLRLALRELSGVTIGPDWVRKNWPFGK